MNMSQLVTRIKLDLGLYAIALPFDNPDEVITDIIINITRPTFSLFAPAIETFRFDMHSLERIEKNANYETYLLPDIFNDRKIIRMKDVRYDEADVTGLGYWGGGVPLLNGNMLNQAMLSNAALALTNRVLPKLTTKFEHPRTITLYNLFSSCKLVFEIELEHDRNLVSIKPGQEESFYNLASLDVKNGLYQTMKHYADQQTVYGNIALKLDDWAQAAADRKQLIDDWASVYHLDEIPFVYA